MKSLVILILVVALAAAAFLTRPTEDDFRRYFKARAADKATGNWLQRTVGGIGTDYFLDHCTYQSKYLWANIEHDGTVIYTGAFGHWIERNAKAAPVKTSNTPAEPSRRGTHFTSYSSPARSWERNQPDPAL